MACQMLLLNPFQSCLMYKPIKTQLHVIPSAIIPLVVHTCCINTLGGSLLREAQNPLEFVRYLSPQTPLWCGFELMQ